MHVIDLPHRSVQGQALKHLKGLDCSIFTLPELRPRVTEGPKRKKAKAGKAGNGDTGSGPSGDVLVGADEDS